MIARLIGKVVDRIGSTAVVDVHGVGYEVLCSNALVARLVTGTETEIIVFTDVKENCIRLFGFNDALEKQVFNLLMRVKGIGAKTALEVVSGIDKRELLRAIGSGDLARLQAVKGVGKKTAERIIVELRDRVSEAVSELHSSNIEIIRSSGSSNHMPFQDAIDALQALGFARIDAENAVARVERSGTFGKTAKIEAGEIVKEALRFV